jgi:thiol:disulfide interchange protein
MEGRSWVIKCQVWERVVFVWDDVTRPWKCIEGWLLFNWTIVNPRPRKEHLEQQRRLSLPSFLVLSPAKRAVAPIG